MPKDASASERAERAFVEYLNLGAERSLEKLRQKIYQNSSRMYHIDTIKKWSKKFNWQERIAKNNEKAAVINDEKHERSIADTRIRQEKIVDVAITALLTKLQEAKKNDNLPAFTYNDLEKILKHELLLKGIIKEQPAGMAPVSFVQINFSQHEKIISDALDLLPIEVRHMVCKAIDQAERSINLKKVVETQAIQTQQPQITGGN